MPRPSKGARLYLRRERRDAAGGLVAKAAWIIRDGGREFATGCAAGEIGEAQQRLAEHIQGQYRADRRLKDIEEIDVADVLALYDEDCRERQANKAKFDERLKRLTVWWGGRMLATVTGVTCRAYAKKRGTAGGARRDLEDLRAAINHHAKEGLHRGVVRVVLPEKGRPRDRWLTRSEAAALLWTCWRAREVQTQHRGARQGERVATDKRPLRHLARFILIGLYTGSRAGAIAAAAPQRGNGRAWVDLGAGIFYRLAEGQRATKKRQPPVPLPGRLLAHMRRWVAQGIAVSAFVEWNGKPIASVKTAFASAVDKTKLPGKVTPHSLRHTCATWLMQAGVSTWEAAGFLGMSEQMVRDVYGHHHPDHLRGAADALGGKRKQDRISAQQASKRALETVEETVEAPIRHPENER